MYTKRNKHVCMNCENLIPDKLISKGEGISLVMICSKGHENKSESCEDHELKSFDWGLKQ